MRHPTTAARRPTAALPILPAFLGYYQRYVGYGFWAVVERSTVDFVGWFQFRPADGHPVDEPELGYRLRKSVWGKGATPPKGRSS